MFGAFPSLAYDSWVAIGAANASETPAGGDYFSVWGSIDPTDQFAANGFDDFEGMNIPVDDDTGGAWIVPFPGAYDENNAAFAHEDLRILIMQITTGGEFSGQALFQVFENADQDQEWRGVVEFQTCAVVQGYADATACSYNDAANWDDGSCLQNDECGICGGNGIPEGECI